MAKVFDKRLQKFQEVKARRKAIAILANEVQALHPDYSEKKCKTIAEASHDAQQRVDNARKGKGRGPQRRKPSVTKVRRPRKPQSNGFKLGDVLAAKL